MALRIAIVEDEEVAARRLLRLLRELGGKEDWQFIHAQTLEQALAALESTPIDLLFLDLNLYGKDGFELLRTAVAHSFHTIVVSGHAERAVEAFELGVLDFVPKPYSLERLQKALARFLSRERAAPGARVLALRKAGRIELIALDQVKYLKGSGNYVEVVTANGGTHLHDKTLDLLAQVLPARFLRVHRSYIVDSHRITECIIEGGGRYRAILEDGTEIPVSRGRIQELRDLLGEA